MYDHCRLELGELVMAAVREEDILAGNVHTPGVFLKRLIIKPGKQYINRGL
jgi:hypothetical protein